MVAAFGNSPGLTFCFCGLFFCLSSLFFFGFQLRHTLPGVTVVGRDDAVVAGGFFGSSQPLDRNVFIGGGYLIAFAVSADLHALSGKLQTIASFQRNKQHRLIIFGSGQNGLRLFLLAFRNFVLRFLWARFRNGTFFAAGNLNFRRSRFFSDDDNLVDIFLWL